MAPVWIMGTVSQARSQLGVGDGSSGSMSKSVSTGCTIPITDQNKCLQTNLIGDIKIIAAYLAVEHTPACMDHMLEHVKNAVKTLLTSNQQSKTELVV